MGARWFAYADARQAAQACAHNILARLEDVLAGRSWATLALSGGEEAPLLLESLARCTFPWSQVHLFWVEEGPGADENRAELYKMALECFIRPARFPPRNVHRIRTELPPDMAAERYRREVSEFFQLAGEERPHFDVVHRNLGEDGHTAGLFPEDPLVEDRDGIAAAVCPETPGRWRVTLLPGVLLAAGHTVFLVAGAGKAEAVRAVFCEPYDPRRWPAQMDCHHGRSVCWFLDAAAARLLQ
ncbi:MAG: 6-phosphogluconolactonase [Bryobacteraceae bacterium]